MKRNRVIGKRCWYLLAICLFCFGGGISALAQTEPATMQNGPALMDNKAPNIVIGPGDLLSVDVFDTPELSGTVRVNQNGEGNLPVVGNLTLAGLTANEASRTIETALKSGGILLDPHVTVSITEYASQGATVMGEVHAPGLYPTLGNRRLMDMIALAGGVTVSAGRFATIVHTSDPQHPVKVMLVPNSKTLASQENPTIGPGDTVVIAKAGIIYILGDVTKSGGFLVDNNEPLSLIEAISLAGGWNKTAALSQVRLIRQVPEGREEIKLDLKHVVLGQQADIRVSDGDIVFVPSSIRKTLAYRGIEAVISAAQQTASLVAINN